MPWTKEKLPKPVPLKDRPSGIYRFDINGGPITIEIFPTSYRMYTPDGENPSCFISAGRFPYEELDEALRYYGIHERPPIPKLGRRPKNQEPIE